MASGNKKEEKPFVFQALENEISNVVKCLDIEKKKRRNTMVRISLLEGKIRDLETKLLTGNIEEEFVDDNHPEEFVNDTHQEEQGKPEFPPEAVFASRDIRYKVRKSKPPPPPAPPLDSWWLHPPPPGHLDSTAAVEPLATTQTSHSASLATIDLKQMSTPVIDCKSSDGEN